MNVRRFFSSIDWITFAPVVALLMISLVTLFSLCSESFKSQAFFAVISILTFLIVLNANPNTLKHYAKPIYLSSLFLLALVLILGVESRGSIRWVEIFGIRIQFSEVLKPFLAVSF